MKVQTVFSNQQIDILASNYQKETRRQILVGLTLYKP